MLESISITVLVNPISPQPISSIIFCIEFLCSEAKNDVLSKQVIILILCSCKSCFTKLLVIITQCEAWPAWQTTGFYAVLNKQDRPTETDKVTTLLTTADTCRTTYVMTAAQWDNW